MRTVLLTAWLFSCCCLPLRAAEESNDEIKAAVAEVAEVKPSAQTVRAFDLFFTLPADWEQDVAISPRIICWRGPSVLGAEQGTIAAEDARPTISVIESTFDQAESISDSIDSLQQTILDLYADAEVVAMAKSDNNAYGYPFLEVRFALGPVAWQQTFLFLSSSTADPTAGNTVILSSSATHWPDWQGQRERVVASFARPEKPAAD